MPRTRALLVALETYANPRHNLPGVSNDVAAFVKVLASFGITDIQVLRDGNATRNGIMTALNQLADGAGPGDVLIFYYSGHGALLPPGFAGSDDLDGQDEALVPYEASTSSLIMDNWLGAFIKERISPETGAFFYGVYDCCHSRQMYKSFPVSLARLDVEAPAVKEVDVTAQTNDGLPIMTGTRTLKEFVVDDTVPNSVHIAACEPENTALVLSIGGLRRSVFTWALEQVLVPGMTLADFDTALTKKQAEATNHHKPSVSTSDANRGRLVFT